MPRQPAVLAALLAPGSIESEIGKTQAALFSEHGCVSTQALPPLIPLAFLDAARVDRSLLREMNRAIAPGWRMRLIGTGWVAGHLFGRIDSAGAWSALRECAFDRCGSEREGLFPAAEGFYLGCSETPEEERATINPPLPELSFGSGTIVLMKISASEGPEWWRALSWEISDERPLRGRKQQ
jgi:hypothetical protein